MERVGDPIGSATAVVEGDTVVVTVAGEVDLSVVDEMREAVLPALVGRPAVALDLAGIEFLDSSGISLLLEIGRTADEVTVRAISAPARTVLEATGLSSWFAGAQ